MSGRQRPRLTVAALTLLVVSSMMGAASGQASGEAPPPPTAEKGPATLDSRLARALTEHATGLGEGAGTFEAPIVVEVFPATGADPESIAASMRSLGAEEVATVGDVVTASLPLAAIAALAGDAGISWIQPAARPVPEAVSEGVGSSGADTWHDSGHTGAGVAVAVVDLGFAGWEARRDAGELPGSVITQNYCPSFTATNHGTAVAEVMHDMAPDARIHLVCIATIADLQATVDYAIANDISVINHSVGWFNTGRGDGTGQLQPVFQAAEAAGITWVNSAGNYAKNHWKGSFTDTDGDGFLDFAPGDDTITFTLKSVTQVSAYLRWDDWEGSDNDFNLYLYDAGFVEVMASTNPQTGPQPPVEQITSLLLAPGTYHVRIHKASAAATPQFDLFVLGPGSIEYLDPVRSINDPSASPLVVASGAARWGTDEVEPFSSRGPNIDEVTKPDLTGPDGVSTSFLSSEGPFFGTSAAAPGITGAAALLRGADRCQSRSELVSALLANTVDIEEEGVVDNDSGAGLLSLGVPPDLGESVVRQAGQNRFETAAEISQAAHPCGSATVFVAVAADFPDALSGASVAGRLGAPILLVETDSIPPATADELARLDPSRIVILGGPAVVSAAVAASLVAEYGEVVRLHGANRYETSVAISQWAFPDGAAVAFVATGAVFADGLAGGGAAVHAGAPLLLTSGTSLPAAVDAELRRLGVGQIFVLGGPAAVSAAVVAQLDTIAATSRLSGDDRYETAAAVSTATFPDGAVRAYVAVGTNFPDALAGGAAAGFYDGPVLLVQTGSIPPVIAAELDRLGLHQIVVLGGTAVISDQVAAQLEAYAG